MAEALAHQAKRLFRDFDWCFSRYRGGRSLRRTEGTRLKKLMTIFVVVLIAGFALFMYRQNAEKARNDRAVERMTSGDRIRPGSTERQDAKQKQRVRNSPAGARFQHSQK